MSSGGTLRDATRTGNILLDVDVSGGSSVGDAASSLLANVGGDVLFLLSEG